MIHKTSQYLTRREFLTLDCRVLTALTNTLQQSVLAVVVPLMNVY
ncbi:hypothetical protein [Scytonema sp. PCC 10023]